MGESESGKVTGVLLVPHEGDPHGLLADGACGARAPAAHWFKGVGWGPGPRDNWFGCQETFGDEYRRALVLEWEGEQVIEGMDRAWRTAERVCQELVESDELDDTDWTTADWARHYADRYDLGTVVLLDENGCEVVDAE